METYLVLLRIGIDERQLATPAQVSRFIRGRIFSDPFVVAVEVVDCDEAKGKREELKPGQLS